VHVPSTLRYTTGHEWVATEGTRFRIGITDYAQDALGEIQFVELPPVGTTVSAGRVIAEVDSMKSVSEVTSPMTGVVVAVNTALVDSPQLMNSDPYGAGWVVVLESSTTAELLLDADSYKTMTEG
jgi:glycine cleavage system H protein